MTLEEWGWALDAAYEEEDRVRALIHSINEKMGDLIREAERTQLIEDAI